METTKACEQDLGVGRKKFAHRRENHSRVRAQGEACAKAQKNRVILRQNGKKGVHFGATNV